MFTPETRILVVDDFSTMRAVIKRSLASLNLTNISEATDGENAWIAIEYALMEKNPFKLVISDWNMPRMSGLELLKKVRSHSQLKNLPFFMITAENEKAQVVDAIQSGVTNFLSKPFTQDAFKEKIEKISARIG